jgi:hypothetical protein
VLIDGRVPKLWPGASLPCILSVLGFGFLLGLRAVVVVAQQHRLLYLLYRMHRQLKETRYINPTALQFP